jgi:hypothetical protein
MDVLSKRKLPFYEYCSSDISFSVKMQCMRSVAAAAAAHSLKVPLKLHSLSALPRERAQSTKRDLLTSTSVLSSMRLKLKIN